MMPTGGISGYFLIRAVASHCIFAARSGWTGGQVWRANWRSLPVGGAASGNWLVETRGGWQQGGDWWLLFADWELVAASHWLLLAGCF